MRDEDFMREALRIAENGRGRTSPNPLVGAVIVKDGRIVAEGWHREAGTPHAEIHALNMAGELARDATLYVTLEPCPMCAGAIMASRISRLVYGATDARAGAVESIFNIPGHPSLAPEPQITAGVMEDECKAMLQKFFAARR